MAQQVFKGFRQVTTSTTTFEAGYLYFVRTNADKYDGYLYFNGKKYGTAVDAASELRTLIGTLPEGQSSVVGYIQSLMDAETARTETTYAKKSTYDTFTATTNSALTELDNTKADTATTLAGYGITNAYTKAETDSAITDAMSAAITAVTEGDTNGTIKANGVEVAVHGLGSAAYEDSTAFDAAGAANDALASASAYTDSQIEAETARTESTYAQLSDFTAFTANTAVQSVNTKTGTSVTLDATDISVVDSGSNFTASTIEGVLAELKDDIDNANTTVSGSSSIEVSAVSGGSQTVSAKISSASNNALEVKNDGLFAAIYYDGDDVDS